MFKILTLTSKEYHNFGTQGFNEFVTVRTHALVEELRKGNTVFQIDSDIVLFKDHQYFVDKLGYFDMICQKEHDGTICTGFFVCKSNILTIEFWTRVYEELLKGSRQDEQVANEVIKEFPHMNVGFFDVKDITSYGIISEGKIWNGEDFEIPKEMAAFHANYTVGLDNKKLLLDKVKKTKWYLTQPLA